MVDATLTGESGLVPENYLALIEAASPTQLEHPDDDDWSGEHEDEGHRRDRSYTPEGEPPAAKPAGPETVMSPAEMTPKEEEDLQLAKEV